MAELTTSSSRHLAASARRLATEQQDGYCDLPHILLADLSSTDSKLMRLLSQEERLALTRGLQGRCARLVRLTGSRPPRSPALRQVIRNLPRDADDRDLLAATLDYQPHQMVPVTSRFQLTGQQVRNLNASPVNGTNKTDDRHARRWNQINVQPVKERLNNDVLSSQELTRDLTAEARAGQLAPAFGRQEQIDEMFHILARRDCGNVLLLGPSNVGKTALCERFAHVLANGEAPARFRNTRLVLLNMASLVAGTRYRGDFEQRVCNLLSELGRADEPVILVIDELHRLVGLGQTEGSSDAGNLLKTELSRGSSVRMIGTTTFDDLPKLESDPALLRRFRIVKVPQTSEHMTREIVERVAVDLKRFHQVEIATETILDLCYLARRYLPADASPGREIALLDSLCAKCSLQTDAVSDATPSVTSHDVSALISQQTGIESQRLTQSLRERVLELPTRLAEQVKGQAAAVALVADQVQIGLTMPDPLKPRAIILLAGPPGTGKTTLARTVSDVAYGSTDQLSRFDLSEYATETACNRLIGSNRGYHGYESGGLLTEAVRHKPYSVVLLDEFEKAHPLVWMLLLQILDTGRLTDNHGREVSFHNTIIMLTTNAGSRRLLRAAELKFDLDGLGQKSISRAQLLKLVSQRLGDVPHLSSLDLAWFTEQSQNYLAGKTTEPFPAVELTQQSLLALPGFPPELLGRLGQPVVFSHLDNPTLHELFDTHLRSITRRFVDAVRPGSAPQIQFNQTPDGSRRLLVNYDGSPPILELQVSATTCQRVIERSEPQRTGARRLKWLIESEIVAPISRALIESEIPVRVEL